MRKIFLPFLLVGLACSTAWGGITNVPEPSPQADRASEKLVRMTQNVSLRELVHTAAPLFSANDYERILDQLSKNSKGKKDVVIDRITHNKNGFVVQAGGLKLVYQWVNKNNIAFKLNGKSFTFEEAAETQIWQPKVIDVIKIAAEKHQARPTASAGLNASWFLNVLLGSQCAHASFLSSLTLTNPRVLGVLSIGVTALIANTFYQKKKKEYQAKIDKVKASVSDYVSKLQSLAKAENLDASSPEAFCEDHGKEDRYKTLCPNIQEAASIVGGMEKVKSDYGFFDFLTNLKSDIANSSTPAQELQTKANAFVKSMGLE